MGYCIDDICHAGSPICGAAGPYHCRADGGPSVDHLCRDEWCEECEHYGYDEDPDDEVARAGFGGYVGCIASPCSSLFRCSEAGDCIALLNRLAVDGEAV